MATSPSTAVPAGSTIAARGLAFADPQHGFLVGATGWDGAVGVIARTNDGGRTWAMSLPGTGPLDAVAVNETDIWVATACGAAARPDCAPGLFISTDGGSRWSRISGEPLTALAFPTLTIGWAVGQLPGPVAPAGVVLHSLDGGHTWTHAPVACPPTTGVPVAVSFPDPAHGWVACNGTAGAGNATKAILATANGGRTWTVMAASPIPGQGREVGNLGTSGYLTGISMTPDGRGLVWMGRGVTARTADGGRTWIAMPPGEWDAREADAGWALDDRDWYLYVTNATDAGPALEVTHDDGRSWTVVATIPVPTSG